MWRQRLRAVFEPIGCTGAGCTCRIRKSRRVQPVADYDPTILMVETQPNRVLRLLHLQPGDKKIVPTEPDCSREHKGLDRMFSASDYLDDKNEVKLMIGESYVVHQTVPISNNTGRTNTCPSEDACVNTITLDILTSKLASAILRAALFECTGEVPETDLFVTNKFDAYQVLEKESKTNDQKSPRERLFFTTGGNDKNLGTVNLGFVDSIPDIPTSVADNDYVNNTNSTDNQFTNERCDNLELGDEQASEGVNISHMSDQDDTQSVGKQSSHFESSICSSTWSSNNANSMRFKRFLLPSKYSDKPVLFFIHGAGGSAEIWKPQLEYFQEKGYESVAVDLIGHGFSCTPKDSKAYTFRQILQDILLIFDQFCKQRNAIVGHSYGSSFAAAVAAQRRHQVSHLILISGGGPVSLVSRPRWFHLKNCLETCFRPWISCGCCARNTFYSPSGRQAVYPNCTLPRYVFRNLRQGQRWPEGDNTFYKHLTIPTLLLHGLKDTYVTLVEECEMEKSIPRSFLELIPEAGHMVMLDSPQRVNLSIHRFLKCSNI